MLSRGNFYAENSIVTKFCHLALGCPVIMPHHVYCKSLLAALLLFVLHWLGPLSYHGTSQSTMPVIVRAKCKYALMSNFILVKQLKLRKSVMIWVTEKIWNFLPPHILQSQTPDSFRRHLKPITFSRPIPPHSAYPQCAQISNHLLTYLFT